MKQILALLIFLLSNLNLPAQSDPLSSYDPDRRLPWNQGAEFTSDAYQWHLDNTEPTNRLFLNGAYQSGETGTNDSDVTSAWEFSRTSSVKVAVIDYYGFDISHEDLAANIWFSTNVSGDPVTSANHGTEVASQIGAVGNNGIGMSGVCQSVPMILIQSDSRIPSVGNPEATKAIDLAVNLGAEIICIPGFVPNHASCSNALVRAGESNVLVVCAALNLPVDHNTTVDYPTSWRLPNVITITTAMKNGSLLTGGAGWGTETVFASAPGRRLPVCIPGGYAFVSATSQASGVAAGIAALTRTRWPGETYERTKERLAFGVIRFGQPTMTGGMLSAGNAVLGIRITIAAGTVSMLPGNLAQNGFSIEQSQNMTTWTNYGTILSNESLAVEPGFYRAVSQ